MNEWWPSQADLGQLMDNVIHEHLAHYGLLLARTEHDAHGAIEHGFTIAVGAAALWRDIPYSVASRDAFTPDELRAVERVHPHIIGQSDAEWLRAISDAWAIVRYRPGTKEPADRTEVGHVELLEALRSGKAHYSRRATTLAA